MEAFLRTANRLGRTTFTLSQREIAENAGIDVRSVSHSLQRLIEQGWLTQRQPGKGFYGTEWQIHCPEGSAEVPHGAGDREDWSEQAPEGPGHDAFRWRALGKGGWAVWAELSEKEGKLVDQLAVQLHKTPKTLERYLKKLAHHGMATCHNGYWLRVRVGLDDVAEECGTLGAGEKQRKLHAEQRELQHQQRALLRQRHLRGQGRLQLKPMPIEGRQGDADGVETDGGVADE
jgi:DNA-binding MarR family transcriptional regulator